jgi:hypothetical protein
MALYVARFSHGWPDIADSSALGSEPSTLAQRLAMFELAAQNIAERRVRKCPLLYTPLSTHFEKVSRAETK